MKRNIYFKHTSLFALLCLLFMQMMASCDGEKDITIIDGNLPIKTSTLFMVGDATPNGWNIDAPTPLTASEADPMIFEWTGSLNKGEMKLCLTTGNWDAAFIRPMTAGEEISKTNITNKTFDMHAGDPDNKWKVTEEGKYKLSFDMRNWTFSTEYLGEKDKPAVEPIVADNVWMIGDATPGGWSLDDATQYTKDANNKYIFTWEGDLKLGTLKACTKKDFSAAFIRPSSANVAITKQGVAADDFVFTTSPDDQWEVKEAGKYRITLDLEHYTIKVEKKD